MKKTNKLLIITLMLTMLLNIFLPIFNIVRGAEVKPKDVEDIDQSGSEVRIITKMSAEKANKKYGGYPLMHLQRNDKGQLTDEYSYILCDFVGYYGENTGKFYPAYCMDIDKPGAENYKSGYDVVTKAWKNDKVYTVIVNGYGYKSASSLGVDSAYDAFVATKQAVYAVLYGFDVNTYFKSTGTARSDKILSAIKSLVKKANNNPKSYKEPTAKLTLDGKLKEKEINGKNYLVQHYKVVTSDTFNSYILNMQMNNLPEGTEIYNEAFSETIINNTRINDRSFNIVIPKENITKSVNSKIVLKKVEIKSNPVFYGTTKKKGTQDYCLISDPYMPKDADSALKITSPDVDVVKKERGSDKLLAGAEYDIINLDTNEVVKHIGPTNSEGKITVKDLPFGKYKLVETKAPVGYNLDSKDKEFEIKINGEDLIINTDDSIITTTIEVEKKAKDDNKITGDKKGTPLAGAKFNIYDINHKLLKENVTTDKNGKIKVLLEYGKYIVEEVRPPEFYLLNSDKEANSQIIEVRKQDELIHLTFEDNAVELGLIIEKTGIVQCQPNDEIRYDFPQLKNNSNVPLDDFTWKDVLPTEYIRATKLYTGTYNEDLNYEIYYKTNKSGNKYIKYKNEKSADGKFNTQKNNYIDFAKLNSNEEYVTEWKVEFGTVKAGFEAVEKPFLFAKVNSDIKADDKWTNHTFLSGNYTSIDGKNIPVGSKDDWTTTSYRYKLKINKLPRTGF